MQAKLIFHGGTVYHQMVIATRTITHTDSWQPFHVIKTTISLSPSFNANILHHILPNESPAGTGKEPEVVASWPSPKCMTVDTLWQLQVEPNSLVVATFTVWFHLEHSKGIFAVLFFQNVGLEFGEKFDSTFIQAETFCQQNTVHVVSATSPREPSHNPESVSTQITSDLYYWYLKYSTK